MRTRYLVFASIVVGIPLTCLPARAQQAPENCLTAPSQKAPEGSQWHYRMDRTGTRKCYFLRADGDKLRSATTKPERQRSQIPAPPADTMSGQSVLSGPPVLSGQQVLSGPQVFGQPMPPSRGEDGVISSRWPDPAKAVGSVVGNAPSGADAGVTVDAYGNMTGTSSADAVAPEAETESSMDYRLMLAFLAGALVVAGVIARMTIKHVRIPRPRGTGPRRPRTGVAPLLSRSRDMMSSIFARAAAAVPRWFRRPSTKRQTMRSAVPVKEPVTEDVGLVPSQGHIDHHAEEPEDIDVLLRQIERLGERPAA